MKQTVAIQLLHSRVSCGVLTEPAPAGAVLENIQKAALRAADHRVLRPWRFLVITGQGRHRLGELFVQAREGDGVLTAKERDKTLAKPLRAPMIIVAIAACRQDDKVPEVEQLLSAGAAVQNMLNAAFAQGVGAMWRTGDLAYDPVVCKGLGLGERERIVGFLYLGTPKSLRPAPALNPGDFFQAWP